MAKRVKATGHSAETEKPLRLEWLDPADLRANPSNWRTHPPAQVDALKAGIAECGWAGALLYNERTGNLIDGHARQDLFGGQGPVPVLVGSWDEATEKKILATLDPLAAMAEANAGQLDALLREVQTGDEALAAMLEKLAAEAGVLDGLGGGEITEDEAPEPPKEAVSRTGDLWILGEHRLLCGDSTKAEDVARVFDGATPFIMVTDPPYGVKLDQSWRDKALGDKAMGPGNARKVENDDRADWTDAWKLFSGDVAYIWHASAFSDVITASLRSAGFELCQQLIWNKSVMVMGRNDYHFKHEPCWYAVRKGKTHGWTGDRTQTTVIDAKSPNHIMSGSDEEKTEHPTQKPLECMAYLIRNHGGDVYDPFLGSGTTLIACEHLGRKCFGLELSPNYCDVIVARWEKLTNREAILESTGRTFAETGRERCVL